MKRIAWYSLVILGTVALALLAWQFRVVVPLLLLSLATAAAFRPLIDQFNRIGMPRTLSLILAYLLVLSVVIALLWWTAGGLIGDVQDLSNRIASSYTEIQNHWPYSAIVSQRMIGSQLPQVEDLFAGMANSEGLQGLLKFLGSVSALLGSFGVILILSLYWNADRVHFERFLLSLIPIEKRPLGRALWMQIESAIGAYIRSEFVQSLLAGVLLWLGYRLIGIDYAVLMAVLGAVAWLIPWFGALLAVTLPVLAGLGTSLAPGILAGIYTAFVLIGLEFYVEPRIFSQKRYSSVILVLVILFLVKAFGVLGLLLAPLVSATMQIASRYLLLPPGSAQDQVGANRQATSESQGEILNRLGEIHTLLSQQGEKISPEVENLAHRLEQLVREAGYHLE